jgi:small-conductance mechanosensitive channel
MRIRDVFGATLFSVGAIVASICLIDCLDRSTLTLFRGIINYVLIVVGGIMCLIALDIPPPPRTMLGK